MAAPIPTVDASQMQVSIPAGTPPGTIVQVQTPSGQMLQVAVPAGLAVGQTTFMIQVPAVAVANNEDEYEAYVPLEEIRFDVTDPFEMWMKCISCPCIGLEKKTLELSDQEVTFRIKNLCGTKKQKRPYAQLGSVDKHALACGCYTLVSDFSPINEKGEGGIKVGCCGTDGDAVDRIVKELQTRKAKRGGIAQIRKLDYVIGKMVKIGTQVPLLLDKFGMDFPKKPAPSSNRQVLPTKVIDVTNTIGKVCACEQSTLTLEAEEVHLSISTCMGLTQINTKREYGEMGYVEKQKNCICCFSVGSDISPIPGQSDIAPGCPCTNRAQVTYLVQELRERMAARGQVGQIRKQEKIFGMVDDVEANLKLVMEKKSCQYPPSMQEMKAKFGDEAPDLNAPRPQPEQVEPKSWDVTSKIDSCLTCCFTCGIAGCTTETMDLKEDDMFISTKNKLDDSDAKVPYAEMDSVDVARVCCCCYSVNEQNPGYGCDRQKVEAIAADLQERKFKRGNIGHLKQLRSMQVASVAMDTMAEALLKKEGVAYPPGQAEMDKIFPNQKPRALTQQQQPHIEPHKEFDVKTYSVTNIPESIIGCLCCPCQGFTTQTLELGGDEMTVLTKNLCVTTNSRIPYGNLGAVETESTLCCCWELPDVAKPGCGCSKDLVDQIAADLQERKVKRGNIAQMKQQENIIIEVLNMEAKMDVLMHKHGIQYPPTPEVMARIFARSTDPAVVGAPGRG